jgi:2-phospho-L-lactate/phosphoenolpyruvate guanylyltransferase
MQTMPRSSSSLAEAGVVIPVRSFTHGKSRLIGALETFGATEHEAFVRMLADRAADAAAPRPTAIVTSAPEVREWAIARGLAVVADGGSLDLAATAGRAWASEQGYARVVVVHADLPDIVTLDAVADDGATPVAVMVPCHRDDGSPVVSIPVLPVGGRLPFEFSYGPGSFDRHVLAARSAGLDVRIVREPALRFDVDGPDDLAIVLARRRTAPER